MIDCPIVITGATGWIGQETLAYFADVLPPETFQKNIHAFASSSRTLEIKGHKIKVKSLQDLGQLELQSSPLVFHFAYITRDKVQELGFSTYSEKCLDISFKFFSALRTLKPRGICYTSSGAVYHNMLSQNWYQTNPYGALKWLDEQALSGLRQELGCPIIIPRVFNITGTYMGNRSLYAIGSMIDQVKSGGPIVINAKHRVRRSYLSCQQLVECCTKWLVDNTTSASLVFDACGDEVVEIQYLAEKVKTTLGHAGIPIIRDFNSDLPADNYLGNPQVMNSLLKCYNISPDNLQQQILNMVENNE